MFFPGFPPGLPKNPRVSQDEVRWKAGHLGQLGGILASDASAGAAQAVVRTAAQTGSLASRRGVGPKGSGSGWGVWGWGMILKGVSGSFWGVSGFFFRLFCWKLMISAGITGDVP